MAAISFQASDLVVAVIAIVFVHRICRILYNLALHPLRSFPGPISHAISDIPLAYIIFRGTEPFDLLELHKKYGDIVRISPDTLAFSHPDVWKEIMGTPPRGGIEIGKWMKHYKMFDHVPTSLISADRDRHAALRKPIAYGTSERAMQAQQPIFMKYVNLLVDRLGERSSPSLDGPDVKTLDISAWYNYTTFDIIGDLAFGQPFGSLQTGECHPYIPLILQSTKMGNLLRCFAKYPLLKKLFLSLTSESTLRTFDMQRRLLIGKLKDRMKLGKEREDLIEGLLQQKDELGLDIDALEVNASLLVIGGSETTATLLTGVTYLLLRHPDKLAKLTHEIRSTFTSDDEIDSVSANSLPYMLACLNEALRVYPPVPIGPPRMSPKGGCQVLGRFIPEGTVLTICQWAAYHDEKYFTDPSGFHPERFLGDPQFANDQFNILQPFHVGPRNCLGKSLAYNEMRLVLAKVLYNFDLKLAPDGMDWMEKQKIYILWDRPSLPVHLTRSSGETQFNKYRDI